MAPKPSKSIVACPNCRQLLNIPADRRKLQLTCPKCRTTWLWSSDRTEASHRFEVRPSAKRNAIILGVISAVFTVGSLWMLFSGEQILVALLGTAMGIGGLYMTPKVWRRDVSMVLTENGLEQRYPKGNAFIPWADIEEVGVMWAGRTKMVGIRLRSYDRYLNDMPTPLAEFMMKNLSVMKLFVRGVSMVHIHGRAALWIAGEQQGLKSFGKVGSLAECMMWSRDHYGYDIGLSWAELDRSTEKFAALLEEYRTKR